MAKSKTKSFESSQLKADAAGAVTALDSAGADATALVQAWVDTGNAAAVQAASLLDAGPCRKAGRRGLNVLKSRGISIHNSERAPAERKASHSVEAWMVPPDPSGSQLLIFGSGTKDSKQDVCFVYLNPKVGLNRVERAQLSRSQLKKSLVKVLSSNYEPVSIPVPWARQRGAEAIAKHREGANPLPMGLGTNQDLLEPVPESAPSHPFDEEGFALSDEDAADLTQGSADLHRFPEFRGWLPPPAAAQEMLVNVGEAAKNETETPSPEEVQERLKAEINAATDRYFTPVLRAEVLLRMKDAGWCVFSREGEQEALRISATMTAIEKCGLITDPPSEIPFLRVFFEKALSLMASGAGGRVQPPPQPTA